MEIKFELLVKNKYINFIFILFLQKWVKKNLKTIPQKKIWWNWKWWNHQLFKEQPRKLITEGFKYTQIWNEKEDA